MQALYHIDLSIVAFGDARLGPMPEGRGLRRGSGHPLGLSNIALAGFDYIMAAGGIGPMVGMAQGLCITLRTKSKKVRDLALPSFISQVMGVGEPLMYSILIPLRKPYAINIIAVPSAAPSSALSRARSMSSADPASSALRTTSILRAIRRTSSTA